MNLSKGAPYAWLTRRSCGMIGNRLARIAIILKNGQVPVTDNPGDGEQKKQAHIPEILEPDDGWQSYRRKEYSSGPHGGAFFYSIGNNDGCIAAFITFILFIISVSSFGLIGGVGFIFFHVCMGIIGSVIAARRMMNGKLFNLWQWRICNWAVSFLLVFWLGVS